MKQIKWLEKNFELMVLAGMLVVMSCLSFANVIMRYCFHNALSWSDEVCCYCLALSAFFALPCAVRLGVSIKVDTFTIMIPKSIQKVLGLICDVIMIICLVWLFKGSIEIAGNAAKVKQASPALGIPIANLYGIMAFGVALTIVRYVQQIYRVLTNKVDTDRVDADKTDEDEKEEK